MKVMRDIKSNCKVPNIDLIRVSCLLIKSFASGYLSFFFSLHEEVEFKFNL